MSRWLRSENLPLADLLLILLAVLGSFALRLDLEAFILDYVGTAIWIMLVAVLVKPFIFRRMGLYSRVWAYASMDEMKLIIRAVTLSSLIVTARQPAVPVRSHG